MADRVAGGAVDLAAEFRALSDRLVRTGDGPDALDRLVGLARSVVPGCEWAGISQAPPGQPLRTLAASDPVVATLDELQSLVREGPGLDALSQDGTVRADDLTADPRWPEFGLRAVSVTPVRSVLAQAVGRSAPRAALNLYSSHVGAFAAGSERVTVLAAHAHVLLMYLQTADKVAQLNRALTTSRVIGAAIGMLMYAHRITAQEAFDRLTRASQHSNRKLVDIAEEVTGTGALPARRLPGPVVGRSPERAPQEGDHLR